MIAKPTRCGTANVITIFGSLAPVHREIPLGGFEPFPIDRFRRFPRFSPCPHAATVVSARYALEPSSGLGDGERGRGHLQALHDREAMDSSVCSVFRTDQSLRTRRTDVAQDLHAFTKLVYCLL